MPTTLLRHLLKPRHERLDVLGTFEARHGAPLVEGELRRFLKLAGELDFAPLTHRAMELLAPDVEGLAARLEEGIYVERIQTLLCATTLIARRGETFFAASWASNSDGGARVYYLTADKWGMHPARTSIASFIFKMLDLEPELFQERAVDPTLVEGYRQARHRYEREARRRRVQQAALDPERLFRRAEWLIEFLLYAFKGYNLNRWQKSLSQAAPFSSYEKERPLLCEWPHLAVYWLWSHFVFDNHAALEDLRELLANHGHAVVRESLALIDELEQGVGQRGLHQRATEFCQQINGHLPDRVLSPDGRLLRKAAHKERGQQLSADERAAMRALQKASALEPSVYEALVLLREIDEGKHVDGDGRWRMFVPQKRLGELVDRRFEPLLRGRIERGAQYPDEDRHASRGVIYAYAQIEESFDAFISLVEGAGISLFGGDRLSELYRAIGSFHDAKATKRLVEAAERYVIGGDSAEGTLHKAAFWQLLRRDANEGRALIAAYLASFDPLSGLADQWTCINAIFAAARLGLAESHDHILRLVGDVGIGYYTNEEHRGPLLRALWKTGGDRAFDALSALLEAHYARVVEAEPGTDEWAKQKHDESCLVAALHMMRPADAKMKALFAELGAMYTALDMTVSPLCFYGMSALLKAIEEARIEGHGELVRGLANHRAKPKYSYLETLAAGVRRLALALLS